MLAKILFLALAATALARPHDEQINFDQTDSVLDELCPPDLRHFLLPHEYDCAKFYYCEYGVRWLTPRDCAPGTYFSFELQVCVHPAQANCDLPGVPPTDAPATEAPDTEAPEPEPTTTKAPETEPTTTKAPEPTTTEAPEPEPTTTKAPEPTTTEAPEPEPTTTKAPEPTTTEAPETEAPTTTTPAAPSSTEASIISTAHTTAPPETTTSAPSSTEASIISTAHTTAAPETTTSAPSSTEASIISTAHTTAAPETTTSAPSSTEVSIISTTAKPETEATTSAPETEATAAPTTSAPEDGGTDWLDNGCPASFDVHWLLPHADCSKFYYCNFGEKVERQCPANTLFNPKLQVCDHPWNVDCANNGDGDNNGESNEAEWLDNGCPADWDTHWLLPHESDCGKFYYCVRGEKVVRECAPPLHFNPTIQVCDWAENAGCELGGGDNNNSGEGDNNGDGDNNGESNEAEWLDNGCPADWGTHWLLPHESDCGKFYYCVRGEKVVRECAPPLHFNPTIQVCDWAENAGCELGGGDNNNSGEGDNNGDGDNNGESNEAEWLDNGCPADWGTHWLLPHESDCGKFYYCVRGEKVVRECAPPLHFNPTIQVCDWAENAGCELGGGDNNNSGEDDNNNGNSGEDDNNGDGDNNGNGDNNGESNENEWLDNGCPADWGTHWLLPHESDCGKFYYCVRGEKVVRECASPLHFNPTIQVCDWPENAGCELGEESKTTEAPEPTTTKAPEPTTTEAPEPTAAPTTSAPGGGVTAPEGTEWLENGCPADFDIHWLLPHESDCGKFYYCVRGEKVKRECPVPLHFNPKIQVCDWPENVGCELGGGDNNNSGEDNNNSGNSGEDGNNNNSDESSGGEWLDNGCPSDFDVHWLLPHESECGKFYYCVRGEKVKRECPEPLHFNPTIQVCDWPENAGCEVGGGDNNNSGEDNNNSGNSGEDDNNGGEDGNNNSDENNGGEWLENGCPADFDVHWLLPHGDDCAKFYYCVFGEKVERECNDPLHFNPTLQVCDWPENAGCVVGGGDNNNSDEDNNNNGNSGEDGEDGENGNNSNEDNNNGGNSGEDNNNGGNSGEEVEPDHNKCEEQCNILPWAHETACDKYWRCEGNKAVLVICSEGLHFNAKSGTCDFICNANCVRESVQTTADQQGLKVFIPWDKVSKGMRNIYN